MKGVSSIDATVVTRFFCVALLGLTLSPRSHASSFDAKPNDQNALAGRRDYTKGEVPGVIGTKGRKFKSSASARAGRNSYIQIDVPGAVFTGLFAINSRGQTVGQYEDGSGVSHGLLRNVDGSIVTIDYPGAIFIGANGINSEGDVVGRWDDVNGITHSFLRTSQGTITSFDPPAPCVATTTIMPSAAHGINDSGDIVGRCFDASGKELGWLLSHDGSFLIIDDPSFHTTDAWAIDNRRVVVGEYSDANDFVHGYTWTEANGFTTLDFESNMTGVRAINQRGDISGIYFDGLTLHGFLRLKNGTEVTIDPPGSVETDTAVVNDNGMIAGLFWDADFNAHGYIAIDSAALH
jgi:hypothetical protein